MRQEKDMRVISDRPKFGEVVHRKKGRIHDYSGRNHKVEVWWDLNSDAIRDQIFALRIGETTAYIDKQELIHYIRAV